MGESYDLAAEEQSKRRYYFIALPALFVCLIAAMFLALRFLPPSLQAWPVMTVAAGGLSIAEAWAMRHGRRAVIENLVAAAIIAGLWVWWRGGQL